MTRNWMSAMKHAGAGCSSRPRIILMVALLMGAALLVMPGVVPVAEAQACCQVTAVSGKSASAVDTKTKTTFQFTLTKSVSLRVGDAVYANFPKKEVSCDGKSICGTITAISPGVARTPVTPKTEGTTEGDARTTPAILASKAEPGVPGCRITAINTNTGEVSARETATGRTFTFAVSDASLRSSLKVGQGVHANFDAKEVSLDGKSVAGRIVSIAAPPLERAPLEKVPLLTPPKGTVGSSGSSSSGSSSSGSSGSSPSGGSTLPTTTVCAGSSTVEGVDVSSFNTVDWNEVKSSGRAFAYARATIGISYTDPTFSQNYAAIKAAGLVRGAYHGFDATVDPTAQANYFMSIIGTLNPGDLPPALDITNPGQGTASETVFQSGISTWLTAVRAATGRTPIVYSPPDLLQQALGSGTSGYLLWIANWGVACPTLPAGWHQWVFWQSSGSGTVPGIGGEVELDEFNGSLADLKALTKP